MAEDKSINPKTGERWKRGDIRADGYVCKGWINVKGKPTLSFMSVAAIERAKAMSQTPEAKEYQKQYQEGNKVHIRTLQAKSKKKRGVYRTDAYRERRKRWEKTPNRKAYQTEYRKRKALTDPIYREIKIIRSRLGKSFSDCGLKKDSNTEAILGIPPKQLAELFKKLCTESGLDFENRDTWHIDHIVPVALAETVDDVIKLNHYTNLRPLAAEENMRKQDSLVEDYEERLDNLGLSHLKEKAKSWKFSIG